MKITFLNEPDPMGIMRTLAELLTKESGGEYIYNVCEDGKAVTDEKNKGKGSKNEKRRKEKIADD